MTKEDKIEQIIGSIEHQWGIVGVVRFAELFYSDETKAKMDEDIRMIANRYGIGVNDALSLH